MKENENLIKKTCKELGLTYRELGEKIGYSEATLNKNASTGEISKSLEFAINLYLENLKLKEKLEDFRSLFKTFKKLLQEES
ncbi:transcriptional regulator [Helicobacter sp. MIT 05-5294]|uniref:transcriptional regulator n=1 Tax=Helicobacter sp. MIT 05-5294 TaxID=1548150 RepID=UPI00051FE264|nr:transcriptional regulator [Helicobacter sp. MIT 05-5294]TLD85550.1 transcriptional regulator [Helicobacter sp. MIT 05-5294]